jgi:predicted amidophosphoribosyltransferase
MKKPVVCVLTWASGTTPDIYFQSLTCNHMFCLRCLKKWREERKEDRIGRRLKPEEYSCPSCRERVTIQFRLHYLFGLKDLLQEMSSLVNAE